MRYLPVMAVCAVALAAAAQPAVAATSATGSQSVTADVANTLEATFPGAYAWGSLDAGGSGNTSAEQLVTVKSNALWGVKIASDQAAGRMTEWDGSAYVASPKVLANALQWSISSLGGVAQAASWASLSNVPALVTGSRPVTDDNGVAVGVTYKQNVSYGDQSAGVNDYRIQVDYTAQQGF